MRDIYIVLTHTGTILSRLIKIYTKDEFSHISLALDEDLDAMYSFGRKTPYNPLNAGFVCEHINKGIFKRFNNTTAKVFSLQVTEEQYEKVQEIIYKMKDIGDEYKFNMIGLVAVGLHIKIKRKKAFYCAEFIKYIIENSKIAGNLPVLIKPEDFKQLCGLNEIYHGRLNDYSALALK